MPKKAKIAQPITEEGTAMTEPKEQDETTTPEVDVDKPSKEFVPNGVVCDECGSLTRPVTTTCPNCGSDELKQVRVTPVKKDDPDYNEEFGAVVVDESGAKVGG